MKNIKMYDFKKHTDGRGNLIPLEYPKELPFEIQRVYYIYDVDNDIVRGKHSHNNLQQILIAVNGSVKILVKTPYEQKIINLSDPTQGLYIGPMIWREMFEFSDQAVLFVLASEKYNEDDYIRDYEEYEEKAKVYFKK